jgi:hypothetical protein
VKRFRKRLLCTLLVLASFTLAATPSQASSFVSGFDGNVGMSASGHGTVIVDYAVVDTGLVAGVGQAGTYLTSLGVTGQAGNTSRYVYLYEVVNTSSSTSVILGTLGLTTNPALYNAMGSVQGKVFANNGTAVTGASTTSAMFNPNGSSTPALGNSIVAASPTVALTSITTDPSGFVDFHFQPGGNDGITPGSLTDVVFLTSNNVPTFANGQVNDGITFGPDGVPVASAPEPQTLALMSTGLIGLGGWAGWRRRFRKTSDLS